MFFFFIYLRSSVKTLVEGSVVMKQGGRLNHLLKMLSQPKSSVRDAQWSVQMHFTGGSSALCAAP